MDLFFKTTVSLGAAAFLAGATAGTSHSANLRGWVVGGCDAENPTILCTTNGADWFRQGIGSVPRIPLHSVAVSPSGARVWVAGTTHNGYAAIFYSADGGATWTRQGGSPDLPDKELYKIRAAGERVVWGVGQDGTVVRTLDSGATWETLPIPGFSGHLQAVTVIDEHTAWAGGAFGGNTAAMFHTTDGGTTWTRQSAGGIANLAHVLGLHAVDANTVWALGGPLGIMVSANAGEWWEMKCGGGTLRDGNEIHVDIKGTVWAATDSAVFRSSDSGGTWDSFSIAEFCMGIDSPDGTNVWAVSDHWSGGMIFHSPDAGATWEQQLTVPGAGSSDVAFAPLRARARRNDYDGDGASDLAVFDQNTGLWYIASLSSKFKVQGSRLNVETPTQTLSFELETLNCSAAAESPNTENPASPLRQRSGLRRVSRTPTTDNRSPTTGAPRILAWAEPWGWPGAVTVPGDYDGDGLADLAVFDQNTGWWYVAALTSVQSSVSSIQTSKSPNTENRTPITSPHTLNTEHCTLNTGSPRVIAWGVPWGWPGEVPVPGDYDGDGASDLAVYHEAVGRWHVCSLARNETMLWNAAWGGPGLTAVAGDYDGDGAADLALYDAAAGLWYGLKIMQGPLPARPEILFWALPFGAPGMTPVPGDYDGDGADDFALYAAGLWCAVSLDGRSLAYMQFGAPGMTPLSGDYDGDGADDFTVYDGQSGLWYAYSVKRGMLLFWAEAWGGPGMFPVRQ